MSFANWQITDLHGSTLSTCCEALCLLETGAWETEAGRGEERGEGKQRWGGEKGEGYAGCMTC